MIKQYLVHVPAPYSDAVFIVLQVVVLALAYFVLIVPLIIVRRQLTWKTIRAPTQGVINQICRVTSLLLFVTFVLIGAATLTFDGYLLLNGESALDGTFSRLEALPPELLPVMVAGLGKAVAAIAATVLVIAGARRALNFLQRRALAWERLTANAAAIDAFFGLLRTMVTTGLWLYVLGVIGSWLGLPVSIPLFLSLVLKVYLIAALGLLVVRGVASVVDTLDALSIRFAGPTTPFRYYHDLRGLIPLLRRCLEFTVWLIAASLVVLQIEPVASLAIYGPRLIQTVGIFFLARAAIEAANLIIARSQRDEENLSDIERQQRATLMPLVMSFVRGVIYFVALVLVLAVLDLNPLPLLAGAGILGVVVGFGAQPVITDVVSGFFVLFENQFLVGDYIEVGSARGVVEAIQLRTTRIRDPNGQQHIVRNGLMVGLVNYSKTYTFAVVEVEVRYEDDIGIIYHVINSIGAVFAEKHPDVLESTVISGIEKFTSAGFVIRTATKVRPGTHGQVARDLRKAVLSAFIANNLGMPAATLAS